MLVSLVSAEVINPQTDLLQARIGLGLRVTEPLTFCMASTPSPGRRVVRNAWKATLPTHHPLPN